MSSHPSNEDISIASIVTHLPILINKCDGIKSRDLRCYTAASSDWIKWDCARTIFTLWNSMTKSSECWVNILMGDMHLGFDEVSQWLHSKFAQHQWCVGHKNVFCSFLQKKNLYDFLLSNKSGISHNCSYLRCSHLKHKAPLWVCLTLSLEKDKKIYLKHDKLYITHKYWHVCCRPRESITQLLGFTLT